jgi:hypothetical protein
LFSGISANPAFVPALSLTPNDFSIGITYTAGTNGNTPSAPATFVGGSGDGWLTADESDNIWIVGMNYTSLVELGSDGTVLSPVGGYGWNNPNLTDQQTSACAPTTTPY